MIALFPKNGKYECIEYMSNEYMSKSKALILGRDGGKK